MMDNEESTAFKIGITAAIPTTVLYGIVFILIAAQTHNTTLYYALLDMPVIFFLTYFFAYTLKIGMIKFLTASKVYSVYDTPVSNSIESKSERIRKSIGAVIVCFIPMCIFCFLFSWIFYPVKNLKFEHDTI